MQPLISVIIPTYNYAHYIADAINSVVNQEYPKELIEIIVVDDGSTDHTKDVLAPFINDEIVKYFYQENSGKASATAKAIKNSSGKYLFNLDADDFFFKDKIKASVDIFENDPEIVHVASPAHFFGQDTQTLTSIEEIPQEIIGKKVDGNYLLKHFYDRNMLYGGGTTYAVRSSVLKNIEIPAGVDMYIDEFLILAVLPFGKSYFVRSALSAWRVHASNYSGKTDSEQKERLKHERSIKSSRAVLTYIIENNFQRELIDIYRIKDATRKLSSKEFVNKKSLKDIWLFANLVFIEIRPGAKIIWRYQILNRLIPTPLFKLLKRLIGKRTS